MFDTLYFSDSIKISKSVLSAFLNIKPASPYNEKKVKQIPQKIPQLGFLQLTGPIKKEFYPGLVKIILPLRKLKTNSIEAIMGVKYENKKLLTSGKIDLQLQNFFNSAENIKLQWQKPKPNWQQFYSSLNFPYIFGWSIGTNAVFFIQKIDTTQLNLYYTTSLNYYIDGLSHISLGFNTEKNLTNKLDSTNYNITKRNLNFSVNIIKSNDKLLTPKGYYFNINLFYGQKLFKSNKTYNLSTSFNNKIYLPIYKNFFVKLTALGEFNLSRPIFDNEVKYIGGIDNFWGFDEKEFKATSYWLIRTEPALNFNKKITFSLWAIKGQIFTKTLSTNKLTTPFSAGFRIILTTQNSSFNLIFGIGTTNKKFNLQQSKFHISYKARF